MRSSNNKRTKKNYHKNNLSNVDAITNERNILRNNKISDLLSIIDSTDISDNSKNTLKSITHKLYDLDVYIDGEGDVKFYDGLNVFASDIEWELYEAVAIIILTEKEIPLVDRFVSKLFS